ncbi:MAG: gliding motility-associated C-terminal domain-containing protein, partial [Bacteroidota bacterium]|nr:gliding motility-associated C-terminal domain-containing protein [Bacteroidota bacterium]MDX5429935.1 gliding motility-associated C-terminal domain-containing protein [Bacteroidota bacterium]MDX5468708.1 gliding motility-associated C-terminal domain-containing protein [Bacteroidota bacterium]
VTSNHNCWDTVSRELLIIPELSVFIPNAFTPNGQDAQINEGFVVVAGNYKSIRIRVFDRWGEEVYQSTDAKVFWDGMYKGQPAQQDVYVYLVEVVSIYDKVYQYSGTLTLLR